MATYMTDVNLSPKLLMLVNAVAHRWEVLTRNPKAIMTLMGAMALLQAGTGGDKVVTKVLPDILDDILSPLQGNRGSTSTEGDIIEPDQQLRSVPALPKRPLY